MKVVLNFDQPGRDRGEKGKEQRQIAEQKTDQWMATNVWPWWIESGREAHHWSAKVVGRDCQGGQCDGLFWRHSRDEWLQSGDKRAEEQLEEYDRPWITANGEQAMADALENTEDAYTGGPMRGAQLEAGRRVAWSMEAGVSRDGARFSPRRFRWEEVWDEQRLGRRWRLVELVHHGLIWD